MSIKDFAVVQTSVLHLRDADDELMYAKGPDGKPDLNRPMRVTVYGPGSKQFARATTKNQNRSMDRLKKKGKADQSADEKTQEIADFLTDCTKSFENIEYDQLVDEHLHRAVYADLTLGFIAKQVNEYLGDWSNFSKASTTKPDSTSGTAPG